MRSGTITHDAGPLQQGLSVDGGAKDSFPAAFSRHTGPKLQKAFPDHSVPLHCSFSCKLEEAKDASSGWQLGIWVGLNRLEDCIGNVLF